MKVTCGWISLGTSDLAEGQGLGTGRERKGIDLVLPNLPLLSLSPSSSHLSEF